MDQKILITISFLLGLSITAFSFYEKNYLLAFMSMIYYNNIIILNLL